MIEGERPTVTQALSSIFKFFGNFWFLNVSVTLCYTAVWFAAPSGTHEYKAEGNGCDL